MQASSVAIGLFLEYPQPGAVKSRLVQTLGPETAARLYWECALVVMAKALRVRGADLYVFLKPPEKQNELEAMVMGRFGRFEGRFMLQNGADPATRIHNALAHLKGKGYASQMLMSTDAPTLPVEFIGRAIRELDRKPCVLGPTWGGTYYLIGVRNPDPRIFEGIAWGTGTELDKTFANLASLGLSCFMLPRWSEIDSADDLPFLEGQIRSADYRRLKAILETRLTTPP